MPTSPDDRSTREFSTIAALVGLLGFAAFLVFLAALVMPQILGVVLVVAGFGSLFVLHYLLWGWWLSRLTPPPEDSSDSTSPPSTPQSRRL